MRLALTAAIPLAALALFSGLATGATPVERNLVGAWDIYRDGCQSGYLEYRADGGFGQIYRRDASQWIIDPLWGRQLVAPKRARTRRRVSRRRCRPVRLIRNATPNASTRKPLHHQCPNGQRCGWATARP